jgi:hypothetical protein
MNNEETRDNKLLSPKADVLDQTRLRPHSTVQRYNCEGKIVNLLISLQSVGKADLTVKFVSDRLKYLKFADLDNADIVNLFIARKQCSALYKDMLVKAYKHYADFCGVSYVKLKFESERKLPRIQTREPIMNVISASSKKYSVIFKILMETGVMPFEPY